MQAGLALAFRRVVVARRAELKPAIAECRSSKTAPLDFVLLFADSQAKLTKGFGQWRKLLAADGVLWIAWPKKSSGVATDLDENVVRRFGLAAKLVDVKVCAIDDVWSGLKFVIRLKDR